MKLTTVSSLELIQESVSEGKRGGRYKYKDENKAKKEGKKKCERSYRNKMRGKEKKPMEIKGRKRIRHIVAPLSG